MTSPNGETIDEPPRERNSGLRVWERLDVERGAGVSPSSSQQTAIAVPSSSTPNFRPPRAGVFGSAILTPSSVRVGFLLPLVVGGAEPLVSPPVLGMHMLLLTTKQRPSTPTVRIKPSQASRLSAVGARYRLMFWA